MLYTTFTLNGNWEMRYQEEKYLEETPPFSKQLYDEESAAGTELDNMSSNIVENAVPGYWEDMTAAFMRTPFFCKLKINPEYGLQQYPIAGNPPDMALPNIVGTFFYRKYFNFQNVDEPVEIHFEGVQNAVSVWINEIYIGRHEGYSTPFNFAIPEGVLKNGNNSVELSVSNHPLQGYADELVSGLTNRASNQYTGGITGDIELRVYNSPLRDISILVSDTCEEVAIKINKTKDTFFTWEVCDGKKMIKSGQNNGNFIFDTFGMQQWSPENPKQYILKIYCGNGTLIRKFGVRRFVADGVHFRLNRKPYYLRGICEHFYLPETIHPNHDYEYYCNIIKTVKKLGFNFIRFHTYIPEEEYMRAADELGILLHVECPNNTSHSEWEQIVNFCSKHTSVVIYCCGNELLVDEPFIDHLRKCADTVHRYTDGLFSPVSALRGVEYFWVEPEQEKYILNEPFRHHPGRLNALGSFSDMYSSYPEGAHSYFSLDGSSEKVDKEIAVYNKPRVSHEICIDGTYVDLSLKNRYKGGRVGETKMFDSIEDHLEKKGLLKNAPLYFRNSCEWQRRIRKYCFELVRRSDSIAGFDFLGPIDTHWHTFGYNVGMMNEFYELKPGETVRNVLMYNSSTVLLTNLGRKTNFMSGDMLSVNILASHYDVNDLNNARLDIRLSIDGRIKDRQTLTAESVENGKVTSLYNYAFLLPEVKKPGTMKLYVTLDCDEVFAENEWELYVFPRVEAIETKNLIVSKGMTVEELESLMTNGKDVVLLGANPFNAIPTSFRISLAGRTSGNLATVIKKHASLQNMAHEGFCSWQFNQLLEGGNAICFETDYVPFNPIIEVVSSHKYVVRQAIMFELKVNRGKLLVCGFDFKEDDPAAVWLKNQILSYALSDEFNPEDEISAEQLHKFAITKIRKAAANTNFAFNANDKATVRKK